MYTPILRNRQSEMLAFRGMPSDIRKQMIPLFDVAAPTKSADQEKAVKYVNSNISRTEKIATGFEAVFADSSELNPSFRLPGNVHPLVAAAKALCKVGSKPIPVTGLHRDDAHNEAALEVMKNNGQVICLRLDGTDVSTARISYNSIKDFLQSKGFIAAQVFLLLDLQCLHGRDKDVVVAPVDRLLALLNDTTWAGIVVGGYGLPEQISMAVQTRTQAYLPRVEQDVFYKMNKIGIHTPVWFADYTVLTPSVVELDWRLIRRVMTPKALYALESSWLVVRGSAFSSHPDGYAQYHAIAKEIVALDEYAGTGFSTGDDYIADRALGSGGPGSPATWITACVNHHMTLTARTHGIPRSP
jgi:hypothetical protein